MVPSEKDRDRVVEAYRRRYKRLSGRAASEEKQAGLRRVDFLKRTTFAGLGRGKSADEWVLHVAR